MIKKSLLCRVQINSKKIRLGYNNYSFVNPENEKDLYAIKFDQRDVAYDINRVSGSFDSIFKIWKSYFDGKAEAYNIKNTGFAIEGRTRFDKIKIVSIGAFAIYS